MSERAEKAVAYKQSGKNCAQSVALAFSDTVDLDEQTLEAMTQTFGVGIGATMEGTCGAIIGANVMLGLLKNEDGRAVNMKRARALFTKFDTQNGATICKDLKGIETGKVLRECNDCVRDAVKMLEEILEQS